MDTEDGEEGERTMSDDLREQLAALAHEQWSGWMRHLFSRCEKLQSGPWAGGLVIERENRGRWLRQMQTPYADLSDAEKESDRQEADRVLALLPGAAPRRAAGDQQLQQIIAKLYPPNPTYCAEPLDIDEARYLLSLVDGARADAIKAFRMDELEAVMLSVDKWFDESDPRLENNPATRAADAREIALCAIEAVAADRNQLRTAVRRLTEQIEAMKKERTNARVDGQP